MCCFLVRFTRVRRFSRPRLRLRRPSFREVWGVVRPLLSVDTGLKIAGLIGAPLFIVLAFVESKALVPAFGFILVLAGIVFKKKLAVSLGSAMAAAAIPVLFIAEAEVVAELSLLLYTLALLALIGGVVSGRVAGPPKNPLWFLLPVAMLPFLAVFSLADWLLLTCTGLFFFLSGWSIGRSLSKPVEEAEEAERGGEEEEEEGFLEKLCCLAEFVRDRIDDFLDWLSGF